MAHPSITVPQQKPLHMRRKAIRGQRELSPTAWPLPVASNRVSSGHSAAVVMPSAWRMRKARVLVVTSNATAPPPRRADAVAIKRSDRSALAARYRTQLPLLSVAAQGQPQLRGPISAPAPGTDHRNCSGPISARDLQVLRARRKLEAARQSGSGGEGDPRAAAAVTNPSPTSCPPRGSAESLGLCSRPTLQSLLGARHVAGLVAVDSPASSLQ